MRLDVKPKFWKDCATLFGTALVEDRVQSSTLKSYMTAIKRTLIDDNYDWNDNRVLVNTLTKACRLINNKVRT